MKTKAAVLCGKNNIQVKEYSLPRITDDELLVKVISNGICMSTYKAAILGEEHKRVPDDIATNPVITGHEFAGIIVEVGANLKGKYLKGEKFVLQPAMGLPSGYSAGYSYPYFGGNATYCIIPKVAIELGCVLPYEDNYFANGSLSEPMSCIIGAFNSSFHTTPYVYKHKMGIKKDGKLALLGSTGPMGLGAIDYAINGPINPKLIVVTDINQNRLDRAKQLIPKEMAAEKGIQLVYINTSDPSTESTLMELTSGTGYDDVFVFAANERMVQQAGNILGTDGCINFFAGPTDKTFSAKLNFYNVHYENIHVVGTSGGSTSDMEQSLDLSSKHKINPSLMVTHIGGLNSAPNAILNLKKVIAGKRIIYPHIELELTAIEDFEKLSQKSILFKNLYKICSANNNLWCREAEDYLLKYFEIDKTK